MKYLMEIHHGIGDIVQYTGLIKSVRKHDPNAFIALVLNKEAYKSLVTLDDTINEIYVVDFSGDKSKLISSIRLIRKQHFDYMVCSLHSRQKSMEFMAVAFGAKHVVGTALSRLEKYNKKYHNVVVKQNTHVVDQNYSVLCGLGSDYSFSESYLICPAPIYDLNKHSVGLCIGTSVPQKTWPIERYIALGEALENKGYSIVLLGGDKEREQYAATGHKNPAWINLLGKTDLIGSASECAQCELIIGGDTGLMHMAAAVGTKTFTLFSCSEPLTHAPYSTQSYYYYVPTSCQFCFGSEIMKSCKEYKCLMAISTDTIVEISESILNGDNVADKYKLIID